MAKKYYLARRDTRWDTCPGLFPAPEFVVSVAAVGLSDVLAWDATGRFWFKYPAGVVFVRETTNPEAS